MRSLSNLLKQSSAAIMLCVSLDSYRRAVVNDNTIKQSDILIKETVEKYQNAQQELIEKENFLSTDNIDTIAKVDRIRELAAIAKDDLKKLTNQENNELIKTSSEITKESFSKMML
jgi:hypothetical protein